LASAEGVTEILEEQDRARRAEQPRDERGLRAAAERAESEHRANRDRQPTRTDAADAQFETRAGIPWL